MGRALKSRNKNSKELAKWCSKVAMDKLAKDIVLIDLTEIETAPADYFVLCSCDSDVQMRAIVEEVELRCKREKVRKPRIEGYNSSYWILLDFFEVVFHIFYHQARKFYNIERLWSDGNFYKLSESGRMVAVRDKTKLLAELEQIGATEYGA
ncbi:ribosome silencing factor [Bacteroidetes/Chlorobi group bacterium Naka2016]|jgi:ribosome-associated protein|nr:MAG: ribosome silencing factor [Bacteroidetes/Chlorobi group bacterium Naka2016]